MAFKKLKGIIRKKIQSLPGREEGLEFWRQKIYYFLSLAFVIFGMVAYIPSLIVSFYQELWGVAILDSAVYILILVLFFVRSIPFEIRVHGLLFIIYVLGVALLLLLGAVGAGLLYLFAFPVLASIMVGFRSALLSIVINFLTLVIFGILLKDGSLENSLMTTYNLESWIIIGVNFLCLNLMVCIPITILINGLEITLKEEKRARALLSKEKKSLDKKNKDLKRINNDLDNFVYTASHDLKAPISNIEGLINILKSDLGFQRNPELKETFELIKKSIDRFQQTIRSLTDVSKAQQEQSKAQFEKLDVEEVFEEVKFTISDLIKSCSPYFYTDFKVKQFRHSKKDFNSIMYNLISNAVKYCSPERLSEVHVSTEMKEEFLLLTVRDNGLGMRPDYKEKLFKMFRRLHDHVEGTGIGLYIIKKMVENNGGKIEVESELGKGSVFRVFLKL